ncbi:hypothetical protein VTN02DRAFT_4801 [Thermoascus thermophilus]
MNSGFFSFFAFDSSVLHPVDLLYIRAWLDCASAGGDRHGGSVEARDSARGVGLGHRQRQLRLQQHQPLLRRRHVLFLLSRGHPDERSSRDRLVSFRVRFLLQTGHHGRRRAVAGSQLLAQAGRAPRRPAHQEHLRRPSAPVHGHRPVRGPEPGLVSCVLFISPVMYTSGVSLHQGIHCGYIPTSDLTSLHTESSSTPSPPIQNMSSSPFTRCRTCSGRPSRRPSRTSSRPPRSAPPSAPAGPRTGSASASPSPGTCATGSGSSSTGMRTTRAWSGPRTDARSRA